VLRAPRTASFNVLADDHFHLLATATELDDRAIAYVDARMRNRWRSLLAVDDLVDAVLDTLEATRVLKNTFVFYTADHGYHLGHWRFPDEKALPYDSDVRVTFFVRGPGIRPNSSFP
jgi:N-acetylglucosamine-6-sulfatase